MTALFAKHQTASIRLTLPLPPSMNAYWATRVVLGKKFATMYVTTAGKEFQRAVRVAWPDGVLPITGRCRVTVHLSMARAGKSDIDNRIKPLLDALRPNRDFAFEGAYLDDSQVDELHVFRDPLVPQTGRCHVLIEAIPET